MPSPTTRRLPIPIRRTALLAGAGAALLVGAGACSLVPTVPGRAAVPVTAQQPRPAAQAPAPALSTGSGLLDAVAVAGRLGPAVGTVLVTTGSGSAQGSGFVVAHSGGASLLVTNNHVVAGAQRIQVLMPDGRHFTATLVGTDPVSDVAVVKLSDGGLPLAQWGDSNGLQVGQQVVAIGNPLGNEGSVTSGIVSALHRTVTAGDRQSSETLADAIQTDAAINPGNSGGPLADAAGQVVGMNTAGSTSGTGIGFAIPSRIVQRVADAIMAGKDPGHPYIGVSVLSEADALLAGRAFAGYGYQVQSVVGGCPAAAAGMRVGDVIEAVDGTPLHNGLSLSGALQQHNPGDRVTVNVLRVGATVALSLTIANQGAAGAACT